MAMIIMQKVANFAKWFPAYEAHDSARVPSGLHNFVVARGINKDSNTVLVALHMDDTAKAKQFAMSPGLMDAMKKAGVIGKPTISYDVSKFHDNTTDASTERAILTFKVKDYDAWKKVFDGDEQDRKNAGMTTRAINVDINDPNKVSLVMVITDMKKTADFMQYKRAETQNGLSGCDRCAGCFLLSCSKTILIKINGCFPGYRYIVTIASCLSGVFRVHSSDLKYSCRKPRC